MLVPCSYPRCRSGYTTPWPFLWQSPDHCSPCGLPHVVQITNIYQSQKYMCPLDPTAPPWLPHQHGINPKLATDKTKILDPLVSISSNTSLSFTTFSDMDAPIASFRKHMAKAPLYGSHHTANLLAYYASCGFLALVWLPWNLTSIVSVIYKGPHTSIITSNDTTFVCKELQQRVQRGFIIMLSVDDALAYFGTRLCISRIASVDQTNYKPWLIYNSSAAPDSTTPSINASTESSTNV